MNLQQLHATPEADLPKVLGRILQPRTSWHWFVKAYTATGGDRYKRCRNCNRILPAKTLSGPCGSDPVDLNDANAANKFRDKYVAKFGEEFFIGKLYEVYNSKNVTDLYILAFVSPLDILLACAGLELERKDNE